MVDEFIPTGGRIRPPVFFLAAALSVAASCSGDSAPDLQARATTGAPDTSTPWSEVASAQDGEMLWDTPPLPHPLTLTVDGEKVLSEVVDAYLLALWAAHCAEESYGLEVEKLSAAFLHDPQELFRPLVRGVVLLREAERRFPQLNEEGVRRYQERMEQAIGTTLQSLLRRYGEDGWHRHVERQFRLRLLKAEYSAAAPEVSEQEVFELYDRDVLAMLPTLDAAVGEDISFAALEPKLRARLESDRATALQESWIDEEMEGRSVRVTLPDGREESWQEHSPPRD